MKISKPKIKLLMAEQLLTTKELAEKMGMKGNGLSSILTRGSCLPSTAGKIASALGVAPREIASENQ